MKQIQFFLMAVLAFTLHSKSNFAQSSEKSIIEIDTQRAKEIYRQGTVKLTKKEVRSLLSETPEALKKFKTGQALNYSGMVICAGGLGVFSYAIGDAINKSINTEQLQGGVNDQSSMNWTLFAAGLGAMVPGALMMIYGKELRVEAVKKHNDSISGLEQGSSIYLQPASEGIGFAVVF